MHTYIQQYHYIYPTKGGEWKLPSLALIKGQENAKGFGQVQKRFPICC